MPPNPAQKVPPVAHRVPPGPHSRDVNSCPRERGGGYKPIPPDLPGGYRPPGRLLLQLQRLSSLAGFRLTPKGRWCVCVCVCRIQLQQLWFLSSCLGCLPLLITRTVGNINLSLFSRPRAGLATLPWVCFLPIHSGHLKFVGRTSRGHTGGRPHRIFSHPPSFCGACLHFSREKDSAISFRRRP